MRKRILFPLIITALILAACSNSLTAGVLRLDEDSLDIIPSSTVAMMVIKRATATPISTPVPFELPSAPLLLHPTKTLTLPTTTATAYPVASICSPLEGFPLEKLPKIVSDPYDPPPMGSDDRHQGVDFVYHRLAGMTISIMGVQVNSVLPGYVAASLVDTFPYGSLVMTETPYEWLPQDWIERLCIEEGQSIYVLYAHLLEAPMVKLGDIVARCQGLGKVGNSGNTDAAHLHLEMRRGPSRVIFTGMSGLLPEISSEEKAQYKLWRTSGLFLHFDPMTLLLQN